MKQPYFLPFILLSFVWIALGTDLHPNLIHRHSIVRDTKWKTDITDIARDSEGSIISVGVDKQPYLYGIPFVAKHDKDLNSLWNINLSPYVQGSSMRVQVDKADNIYVAGSFGGAQEHESLIVLDGGESETAHVLKTKGKKSDNFVLKYNSNGNLLWAKRYGDEIEDLLGNFYVSKDGEAALVTTRDVNKWSVTKLNSDGSVAWDHQMGAASNVNSNNNYGIAIDAQGHVIVAHDYTKPTTINGQELPFEEYQQIGLMIKFDLAGEILWHQIWKLPKVGKAWLASRVISTLDIDAEGNIYAGGKDRINVELGAFVTKVSPSGEKLWEVKLEGGVEKLEVGEDGFIYTSGRHWSHDKAFESQRAEWGLTEPFLPNPPHSAPVVAKISPQGTLLWKNTFNEGITEATSLALYGQEIAVAFGFVNNANFGGETFQVANSGEPTYTAAAIATYDQVALKEEL